MVVLLLYNRYRDADFQSYHSANIIIGQSTNREDLGVFT